MARRDRGQFTADIGTVVALLVVIAIGAVVLYSITGAIGSSVTNPRYQTKEREFKTVDRWNLENTAPLAISHNSTDKWIDVTATDTGRGTANVNQSIKIEPYDHIDSATLEVAWQIAAADNITNENFEAHLIAPDGADTVVAENRDLSATCTWETYKVDISDMITDHGTYKIKIFTEAELNGSEGTNEANVDNSQLTIKATSHAGGAVKNVEEKGGTAFNLLTILAIVVVAAVIIGVVVRAIGGFRGRAPPAPTY